MNNSDEQDLASLRDRLPRVWYAMYMGSIQAGFSEAQAFTLTTVFILAQNPKGIRPDSPGTPPSETE